MSFDEMDTNKNGRLEPEEIRNSWTKIKKIKKKKKSLEQEEVGSPSSSLEASLAGSGSSPTQHPTASQREKLNASVKRYLRSPSPSSKA